MPGFVTQFADGFPRRAFTVDAVLRMSIAIQSMGIGERSKFSAPERR